MKHFTELFAYQSSSAMAHRIYLLSQTWPPEEKYSLTDQIRRASRSIGANLAESWGKRRYPAHFLSKLTDADAENHEVEHWLSVAHQDGYLKTEDLNDLLELKRKVGRLIGGMIENPEPYLLR